MKKVLFLTGTRADFGKLKSLLFQLEHKRDFEVHIFVTGMHMLKKYGYTYDEIEKCGFKNIYKYINQNHSDTMDSILAKTVQGFSDYVKEIDPDMIVVHGDRVEALAGSIVGSLNNILVAHIEGGEVSGAVDGLMRHAITKMSHIHFVANQSARRRLLQLGESRESIYEIGSPDMDILVSKDLPSLEEVQKRYEINFDNYAILLFHPVTTELKNLRTDIENLVDCILDDSRNYVVIYPNNDEGTDTIFYEYNRIKPAKNCRLFPSMRFEYFLTLLKNAQFIIGNSSAGIREAPFYGVPCVNIGTRQANRGNAATVIHSGTSKEEINSALQAVDKIERIKEALFGEGKSNEMFLEVLEREEVWSLSTQKYFVDLN